MKKLFTSEGIIFHLEADKVKLSLPIDPEVKGFKKYYKSEDWEVISLIEQLWLEGLISQIDESVCLLPVENVFGLEEEVLITLEIPNRGIDINVYEKGMVASKEYSIRWEAKKNGITLGGVARLGCIIKHFDDAYLLTRAQYKLIKAIDELEPSVDYSERARNIAYIKKLAEDAGASLDCFTKDRDFFYVDNVELDCESSDPQSISITPLLEELPKNVTDKLDNTITHACSVVENGHINHVFFDPDAKKKYNTIKKIGNIEGVDVPKFMDNPLSYLGDELEFDQDKFAERVKGLKIHKSSAQPFVSIVKDDNTPGWFDVTTGIRLVSDSDELDEFNKGIEEEQEELKNRIEKAREQGDEYIFFNNQWVKVEQDDFDRFDDELKNIDGLSENGKLSEKAVHQVLDIYDNVEGFEYSETDERINERQTKIYPVPDSFKGMLKPYQVEGYSFLCSQYEAKMGSLLADDMGLGKTAQVIAFLLYLRERGEMCPALIVVPSVLIQNWIDEIDKFGPGDITPYTHIGPCRTKNSKTIEESEVVITTYETLARDQIILGMIHWKVMICDETQKIKNYKTLLASAVKGMNADCRIAMTGTPVENRLGELWSIVDYVQPGLMKDYKWFKKNYEEPIQSKSGDANAAIQELISLINPIMLRRLKTDVLVGLPKKRDEKYHVELSKLQVQMYKDIVDGFSNEECDTNMLVLQAIQNLIMLCSHPRITKGDINVDASKLIKESTKLADTIRLLKEIKRRGEKVLIFSKFRKMQNILKRVIYDEFGIDPKVINGEGNVNRQECVSRFNASKGFNVLILSPKAAGVGLNITSANNVIHYTREWNPAIENQATDRVYRIGQERDVTIFYPIATYPDVFTVEQKLNDLLENKRELMRNVVVPMNLEITVQDMMECLM